MPQKLYATCQYPQAFHRSSLACCCDTRFLVTVVHVVQLCVIHAYF